MAFYNQSSEPTEDDTMKGSKFNEAYLKMHRIHKLQDTINLASLNPLLMHNELKVFNYQIIIRCCNSLVGECWAKLKDEHKKDALSFKKAIETSLRKYPIHEEVINQNNNQTQMKFNEDNYDIINEWIENYKLKVKELLGIAEYDSPNRDIWDEDDE